MQNESVWIPELNLLMRDKVTLQTPYNPFPCKIVNAVQRLLKLQFKTEGLQHSYAAWYDMQPVSGPAVQILSDLMAQHCFTTCYRNGGVQVADSDPGYISLHVFDQIEVVYKNVVKYPLLNLEYLQVDRQAKGSYDCVLYAIAFAYELLSNGNVSSNFDNTKMREHLIKCLEDRRITEFP
ncbi:hypothetical protein XELAEV_18031706mg [Xenopus laevis]|uniref:Ubiquitin-like protease family profile domain-containing protein n=1 Tax=Xenopus laevis TaxID=8355 RepID=A0A974HG09_XENLA|nr:hypothetical protein XELAEV_18031706mg [Xenopus laevis]